ncbi:helix-turn-helix domain-containing protein [Nocardiopsis mangrovi]|uniref:Helix-turn-helix domain-containing protein n=1 Tax=Nocardiopsis mangrovi TaxID=1179818 RepID=A0ABV9DX45_9ACTN
MVIRGTPPGSGARAEGPVRRGAADSRRLPLYAAGEIDVEYVVRGTDEAIDRDTAWEEHSHPTHELLWNRRGASSASVGPRVWTITPMVGLWIPAGTPHAGWTPAGTVHHAVQFRVRSVPAISGEPVAVDVTPLLRLLLDRLTAEGLDPAARARTEAVVFDLLAPARNGLLLRIPESRLLAPIVAAVGDDPADATTLAGWASRLGVSTRTITRAFQAETGLGFSRWLATARAQRAVELLARGEQIADVAEQVGYHSASAFGTAFRRVTGMNPARYRSR